MFKLSTRIQHCLVFPSQHSIENDSPLNATQRFWRKDSFSYASPYARPLRFPSRHQPNSNFQRTSSRWVLPCSRFICGDICWRMLYTVVQTHHAFYPARIGNLTLSLCLHRRTSPSYYSPIFQYQFCFISSAIYFIFARYFIWFYFILFISFSFSLEENLEWISVWRQSRVNVEGGIFTLGQSWT